METSRNEMADSIGPDGEYLFPDLRQVTAAGDVVIDPEYLKPIEPSLAGEPGLNSQPDASQPTPASDASGVPAEPVPADPVVEDVPAEAEVPAAEADPIPAAATAGDPGLDQPDAQQTTQPDAGASGAAEAEPAVEAEPVPADPVVEAEPVPADPVVEAEPVEAAPASDDPLAGEPTT